MNDASEYSLAATSAPAQAFKAAKRDHLTITVEHFTPLRRGTQIGTAAIVICGDITIGDVEVHEHHGNRWVQIPTGLRFSDPGTANCFSQMVVKALLQAFPDAFAAPSCSCGKHAAQRRSEPGAGAPLPWLRPESPDYGCDLMVSERERAP